MRFIIIALVILGLSATSAALAGEKVIVCHATGSQSNPYVEIEVAKQAWESGHSPHAVHVRDYLGTCLTPTGTAISPEATPTSTTTATPTATSTSIGPVAFPSSGGAP